MLPKRILPRLLPEGKRMDRKEFLRNRIDCTFRARNFTMRQTISAIATAGVAVIAGVGQELESPTLARICIRVAAVLGAWFLFECGRAWHDSAYKVVEELDEQQQQALAAAKAKSAAEIKILKAEVAELRPSKELADSIRDMRKRFYNLNRSIATAHPKDMDLLTQGERDDIATCLHDLETLADDRQPNLKMISDRAREEIEEADGIRTKQMADHVLVTITFSLHNYAAKLESL